jgi:hypothetical protein
MSSNPDFTELEKLSERSITKMSNADSLTHIGKLIDKSDDTSFERGSKRAFFYSNNYQNVTSPTQIKH